MKPLLLITLLFTSAVSAQPIDKDKLMIIGGIKQAVWIKGDDIQKPLLLFLHGGPGNSVMPYAEKFSSKLYKHFVVVHWDQREVGKTLQANASPVKVSAQLIYKDAEELVDSLLQQFEKQKLFIVGHSWGTAIGFHLVKACPEKIEGYVAIGSMVHQLESEKTALDLLKSKARAAGDVKQIDLLNRVNLPFSNGEQLFIHRKALLDYMGSKTNCRRGL